VTNVRSGGQIAMLGALLAALGGCAAIGFDPLEDSNGPLPFDAGNGGSGGAAGTAGPPGGSGGSSGQISSGSGGTGGRSGQGGSAGSAGNIRPIDDASVPLPDAGPPPVTVCTGKLDGADCEDDFYCTDRDFCLNEVCISGRELDCDQPCNEGTCDEVQRKCLLTPHPDGTECGYPIEAECFDGKCSSPTIECTTGECTPDCINPVCDVECSDASLCRTTCDDGEVCDVDCQGTVTCELGCTDATCDIDCRASGTCQAECTGEDAVCEIRCTDPSGCQDSTCLNGATCVLFCDEEAEDCGFAECWANDQQHCPDGSVRCYDDCPAWEGDPDAGP
jgi:hypothetical protein